MARPRVLLTGFGPFPGAPENVSEWLVETLAGSSLSSKSGCELRVAVLPTEWNEVSTLGPRLLDQHQPRLILHFGLNRRARSFRIERSAHNRIEAKHDARGELPSAATILGQGRHRLDTALPAAALARHLKQKGVPAATSRSAGTYLCNFLYYLSLDWAARQGTPCDACFVHVPPAAGPGARLSEAELLRGAEAVMCYLIDYTNLRDGAASAAEPAPAPWQIERG
ncbi:MAG: pyroglutamyl-peptidase I [Methyloceanibacter sp.]|jgi:pyroglutamyl-peptidase